MTDDFLRDDDVYGFDGSFQFATCFTHSTGLQYDILSHSALIFQ